VRDTSVPAQDPAAVPFAGSTAVAWDTARARSDQQLAQVLVEFAHTLGTDFSVQPILDRLVHRVLDVVRSPQQG
jgi:hypothetical protein